MKTIINKSLVVLMLIIASACSLDDIENPNDPTYSSFTDGATEADVNLIAVGLEAIMRNDFTFHYQTVSIIGREYYDLTGVDPRFTGELLKGTLDNNGFLTTRAFAAWYKIVQTANLLIEAVENAEAGFSAAQTNGYLGYAKTLKAYALLMVANRQYDNGIRIEVADPDNLGPIVGYDAALDAIQGLFNEANTDLQAAGDEFNFPLSSGFDGFDTPADFTQFNRALAARTAIYRGERAEARGYLADSFLDLAGGMNVGVYHVFGLTGNDISNGLYYIPDQSGQEFMAHDSFVADADPGDTRVANKVDLYEDEDGNPERVTFDNLGADYQVVLYSSNVDPVAMIRNEELILLWAEANIGSDNAEAESAINIVRNAASVGPYGGATTDAALEAEVVKQRRYSLFGEGHRWIDMRRYNRIDEIPTDRSGDVVAPAFPTPVTETFTAG